MDLYYQFKESGEAEETALPPGVWPVRTPGEEIALRKLCAHAETELISFELGDPLPQVRKGSGVVVSCGPDTHGMGALYAHLTGRRHLHLETLKSSRLPQDTRVLVLLYEQLSYGLLPELYLHSHLEMAPGIVFGLDVEELRKNVLLKSAAFCLAERPGPQAPRLLWKIENSPVPPGAHPYLVQNDASDPATSLEWAGELDKGTLQVFTHCDGLDLDLTPFMLCPLKGELAAPSTDPSAPWCVQNQYCYRLKCGFEDLPQDERLIHIDALKARILLLNSCLALQVPPYPVGPKWRLGRQFMGSPTTDVVLATWKIEFTNASVVSPLEFLLEAGEKVGKAVQLMNQTEVAQRLDVQFCILGDPEYALPPGKPVQPPQVKLNHYQSNRRNPKGKGFHEMLLHSFGNKKKGEVGGKALELAERLSTYLGLHPETPDHVPDHLQAAYVEVFLSENLSLLKYWLQFTEVYKGQQESLACRNCGETVIRWTFQLDAGRWQDRILYNCPNCTFTHDLAAFAPTLHLEAGPERQLHFQWPEGSSEIRAWIFFEYKETRFRQIWEWQAQSKGEPESTFFIPQMDFLEGDFYLMVLVFIDGQLHHLQQPATVFPGGRLCIGKQLFSNHK